VGIAKRPGVVEQRKQIGHWESDTVVSRESLVSLNVLVERKTRLTCLDRVERKTAEACSDAIISALENWPSKWLCSLTYDNGSENVLHQVVNSALGTRSYFCNPYHSWEKGTVENTIGIIRRLWPKKTDFSKLSQRDIIMMQAWLNNRPRKCLKFKTPIEACLAEYAAL